MQALDSLSHQFHVIEKNINDGNLSIVPPLLNEIATQYPNDSRVYLAGWMLARKSGNKERALESAQRAAELAPSWVPAIFALADSLRAQGHMTEAKSFIEDAIKLEPHNLLFYETAITIANALEDYASAERHLRKCYAINPGIQNIKSMIGNSLRDQSKFDEAVQWYNDALAVNPVDLEAHYGLAMHAYRNNDLDTARKHIETAAQIEPENEAFPYLLEIFSGKTPRHQPSNFNIRLFERYALNYDKHLVGTLRYRVPKLISERILKLYPDRQLSILDLGCGTGLLGLYLGQINGHFAGVDLSPAMLEKALQHQVYSRLHNIDVNEALRETPPEQYEVITAAEVFNYIGALNEIIVHAHKVLRKGGHFLFSCETAPTNGADLVLNKNLRYSHKPSSIRQLLEEVGFINIDIQDIELRLENGISAPGFLVSTQKAQ